MEWYYVWWPWLTSKCVARVCQHQLSFLCVFEVEQRLRVTSVAWKPAKIASSHYWSQIESTLYRLPMFAAGTNLVYRNYAAFLHTPVRESISTRINRANIKRKRAKSIASGNENIIVYMGDVTSQITHTLKTYWNILISTFLFIYDFRGLKKRLYSRRGVWH